MNKVLYIEDEVSLAEIVKESIESKGFEVKHAFTFSKAILLHKQYQPDIIIVDVMLPDGDGFDWVDTIRKSDALTPIIFLTSRSQTKDVVKGFELGGNDYLKKPFSIAELVIRMEALLKRKHQLDTFSKNESFDWQIGTYTFRYPMGELQSMNKKLQLTSRESNLLQLLLVHRHYTVSRNEILQTLWNSTDYFASRSLDVFISKLRKYLSSDSSIKIINLRGLGYKMIY